MEILNKESIDYTIIEYLKFDLTKNVLVDVYKKLNIKPSEGLRKNEKDYKDNDIGTFLDDDDKIIEAMIKFPKIIERPIVIIGNKAVIGRPPEKIYEII